MRELKTSDIFKMSKILKKMGIKVVAETSEGKDKSQNQMGAELVVTVLENIHLAEFEVNEFLGDLSGMTGDEFSKLSISEALKIIKEFKDLPGVSDFLQKAGL